MTQLLYIETFGCQMNERDSEIMAQLLGEHSYVLTNKPEQADVVVVNTCSIRGKAAHKAYSCFGRYKKLKEKHHDFILAVTGCVAQQDGAALLERMPYIDIVMGPQSIYALPSLVATFRRDRKSPAATDLPADFIIPPFSPTGGGPSHKRFITIMQGAFLHLLQPLPCREISRSFTDILLRQPIWSWLRNHPHRPECQFLRQKG
jgi:tRNA-2-methylthio-N6-dimethylallyladenosine synthase